MTGFKLFFALLAALNGWRFLRTRDYWYLGLGLLFATGFARDYLPPPVFALAITAVALWVAFLTLRRRSPHQRMIRALGYPRLRKLTPEESRMRDSLPTEDRDNLDLLELIQGERLPFDAARDYIEQERERKLLDSEQAATRAAETEAEQAIEREFEQEDRELSESAASSAIEVKPSPSVPSAWLKIETIDDSDDDLGYMAPVSLSIWDDHPDRGKAAGSWIVSLFHVIGFPPREDQPVKGDVPIFWKSSPPAIRELFKNRCLVAGVRMNDDGRQVFDYAIEDRTFAIRTKYLSWLADLALDDDRQRVWVRLSHVLAEIWSTDPEEDDSDPEYEGPERIPAFLYSIPVTRLMPQHNPKAFFESMADLDERCWQE
jgi:hypothetical protein